MFDLFTKKYNQRPLDLHFFYSDKMKEFYKKRDNPKFLQKAIEFAQKQIDIADTVIENWNKEYSDALPRHEGYDQLRIIYEKQGEYEKAMNLAQKAKKQGWNGRWDTHIKRYSKKLYLK